VIAVVEKGSAVQARSSRRWASTSPITHHSSRITVGDTYDNMDRLKTRKDALNRQERYEYDPAGNLSQFTDRKHQPSTFTYDALNRRTHASYADGSSTAFTYDSVGRLAVAEDSVSGKIEFTYDTLDRLIKELTPQGVVNYGYDALGRRTTMTANGQAPVGYQYDAASRLTQVAQGSLSVGLGYDAAGRRTSLTYPNGTNTTYSYDNASRLTNILHNGPAGVIESLSYSYDAAGNRISLTRTNGTATLLPQAVQAAYDAANQQVQFNNLAPNLGYDANGNLTSRTDASGTTTYTWDARNRLVAISGPSLSLSFQYDALGRRIGKTVNGVRTGYLYDGRDITQEIANGAISTSYLRSLTIDEPLARQSISNQYYHTDSLGSTLVLTDVTGAVMTSYQYEAFGKTTITEPSFNPFQYTGRENDGTGLYYYRARYYSPELSRFISEDPLDFDGGDINLYSYTSNDPIDRNDPDGRFAGCIVGAAISGALIDAGVQIYGNFILGNPKGLFSGVGTAALFGAGKGALLGLTCGIAPALKALRTARELKAVGGGTRAATKARDERAIKEVIERKALGKDGATSRHIIERNADGTTRSVTHRVERDGNVIHQHQTHIGKHGTERDFPDEWIEYPRIN